MTVARERAGRRAAIAFAGAIAAGLAAVAALAPEAAAQGWGWSWPWSSQPNPPPVPREPVYRPPGPGQPGQPGQPFAQQAPGGRPAICLQLEQRLAQEANRGSQSRDQLPRLEADYRQLDRQAQITQVQLDRSDCFEYFLFSKSLKRTRQCIDLAGQLESTRRRLSELEAQIQQMRSSSSRSYQDDIVRELARNGCGAAYQQEASRRGSSPIWQDEDEGGAWGGRFGSLPFATFRTVCVRLCDGYFFPVSFSTLPSHFDRDADVCQSRCAAPAELFYHQNPGGGMEAAISHKTRQAYMSLKTAFRYRKEFVPGCSCKQAEYLPGQHDRRAEAPVLPQPAASAPPKR
jgi:hypothetical protein